MPNSHTMNEDRQQPGAKGISTGERRGVAKLLPPLLLFALQPLLGHIVTTIAARHPELFRRLGDSARKRFLIRPTNLPFFLLLQPDVDRPRLRAFDRRRSVDHDVQISGTFPTLLRMIDGQTDSDALFFNRDLTITGDTEAVVALRNALDDMETTLADSVAASFGPLSGPVRAAMNFITGTSGVRT